MRKDLENKINKLTSQIASLTEQRKKLIKRLNQRLSRRTFLFCGEDFTVSEVDNKYHLRKGCGRKTSLGKLNLYKDGRDYYFVCPKCGYRNNPRNESANFIIKNRKLFKEIIEVNNED